MILSQYHIFELDTINIYSVPCQSNFIIMGLRLIRFTLLALIVTHYRYIKKCTSNFAQCCLQYKLSSKTGFKKNSEQSRDILSQNVLMHVRFAGNFCQLTWEF
jgi:hypothetical protein